MVGYFEQTELPLFNTIINQISEAVCVLTSTGNVIHQNLAANLILGGDYENRHIDDLTDLKICDSGDRPVSTRELFLGDGRPAGLSPEEDYKILSTTTGRSVWVRAMTTRHICPDSGKGLIILTMKNMTSEIQERERLSQLKQGMAVLNRAKMEFIAKVSHEIRSPLSSILGFTDMLFEAASEPERQFYRKAIERNGAMLLRLLDDILDLAKIEARKFSIRKSDFELMKDLAPMLLTMQNRAWEKNLVFQVQVARNVPKRVYSDPLRLNQILANLLDNAIRFTQHGVVRLKIQARENSAAPCLEFLVSDTGVGIPQEQTDRLFLPFEQVGADLAQRAEGAGLGLVLAKRLAITLGGDVELVRSTPEKGSTFRIWIDPTSPTNELTVPAEPLRTPIQEAAPSPLLGLHALLVEDGADNRYLFSTLLEKEGMTVETAANGKEALEKLTSKSYDVTLMDLQMPVLDGYAAARELRKRGYNIPLIALTAHAMKGEEDRCKEAGFDAFLAKPVSRADLAATISRFAATTESVKMSSQGDSDDCEDADPDSHGVVFERVEQLLSDLQAAAELRISPPETATTAHRLTTTLRGCGFYFLVDMARRIEESAKRGRPRESLDIIAKLRTEIERIAMQNRREGHSEHGFKLSS